MRFASVPLAPPSTKPIGWQQPSRKHAMKINQVSSTNIWPGWPRTTLRPREGSSRPGKYSNTEWQETRMRCLRVPVLAKRLASGAQHLGRDGSGRSGKALGNIGGESRSSWPNCSASEGGLR